MKHEKIQCVRTNSFYGGSMARAHSGHWTDLFQCPTCKREGKFLANFLGQRRVMCDGEKFTKEKP